MRAQGWEGSCEASCSRTRPRLTRGRGAGRTAPSLGAGALPAPALTPTGLSTSPRLASWAWAHQSLSAPWWLGLSRSRVTLLAGWDGSDEPGGGGGGVGGKT